MVDINSDHDILIALATSFDIYIKQDARDKQAIRDDIKNLDNGLVSRIQNLETKAVTTEVFRRENAEVLAQVAVLNNAIFGTDNTSGMTEDIKKLESAKNWIWVIVAGYIVIISAILGFFIYQQQGIIDEHKNFTLQQATQNLLLQSITDKLNITNP